MAIRPNDRRRLARLAMPRVWEERRAVEERVRLRDRVGLCLVVALLLSMEEIDPESTCIMDRCREAEAALDAIPDTPELEAADEAYLARTGWIEDWRPMARYRPPRQEDAIESEVERLIGRYRADPLRELDVAQASGMELYAWCLSRHGATIAEATENIEKAAADLLLLIDELPADATQEDIERAVLARENQ